MYSNLLELSSRELGFIIFSPILCLTHYFLHGTQLMQSFVDLKLAFYRPTEFATSNPQVYFLSLRLLSSFACPSLAFSPRVFGLCPHLSVPVPVQPVLICSSTDIDVLSRQGIIFGISQRHTWECTSPK